MYKFRLKFEFPRGGSLNCKEDHLQLYTINGNIFINLYPDKKEKSLKDANIFIIEGTEFPNEEKAFQEGKRIQNALLWYGTKNRVGVNFKKNKSGGFTNYAKELLNQKFKVKILDDIFGLMAYSEDDEPVLFMSISAEGKASRSIENFLESFQQGLNIQLSEKEKLSFELFNSSFFELSVRAKFLTLIIAIESLIVTKQRSCEIVSYITALIEQTKKSRLSKNNINILTNGLGKQKIESISSEGKNLIKKYLKSKEYNNKNAVDFFNYCYEIRSNLVHNGNPEIDDNGFNVVTNELSEMVSDLLVSIVEEK